MKSRSEVAEPQSAEPVVKMTIATRNTVRAPKRSAIQPEIGIKTASVNKYEVSASLSAIGSSRRSIAIAGSAVEINVESSFSMKSAQATIRGMIIWWGMGEGIRAYFERLE